MCIRDRLKSGRVPDVDPNATELVLQKRAVDDLLSQRLIYILSLIHISEPTRPY